MDEELLQAMVFLLSNLSSASADGKLAEPCDLAFQVVAKIVEMPITYKNRFGVTERRRIPPEWCDYYLREFTRNCVGMDWK